ncbi:WD40 repeat-like protein [Calocera cornea HHB12733]|uniref:WD40 repeat-like protein n=1 Tax=Calocera cornea HHB12733 TaxID=1353952 RepID=A0A165GPZ7_9BASI|nr:WD40 repeat-like protein [Calocera cornea HHB12733]
MSGPEKPSIDRKSTGTPLARKFADLRVVSSSDVPTLGTNGTRNGSTKSSSGLRRAPDGAANDKGEKRENWFSAPNSEHPYELVTIVTSPPHTKPHTWHHAAYFPWGIGTNPAFARGRLPALRKAWEDKQRKYSQVVAICGGDEVRLFRTTVSTPYKLLTCIKLDQVDGEGKRADLDDGRPYVLGDRARALTWAVDPSDLSILLCFGGSARLIYVWDVDAEKYRSCIRGHGQTIMHLTTHPVYPYIIASSSRDRSTRIYDLTLQQSFQITYAPLPDGMPNRGNFPMGGLPVTKKGEEGVEGEGPGKCIAVVGWYVKGHRDAIVGADFHPTLPLLATCGLDHAVRIWALPKLPIPKDKPWEMAAVSDPLFGTRLLHSSPLDSIFWITDDILISKSWDEMDDREGVVVIWQWTELDRFFPPNPSGTGRTEIYWEPNREPFQVRTWDVDNSSESIHLCQSAANHVERTLSGDREVQRPANGQRRHAAGTVSRYAAGAIYPTCNTPQHPLGFGPRDDTQSTYRPGPPPGMGRYIARRLVDARKPINGVETQARR